MSEAVTIATLDAEQFYGQVAAKLNEFDIGATVEDTGGGVLAVVIGSEITLGGLQDNSLLLCDGDNDPIEVSIADCVARAIVQRLNVADFDE